MALSMLTWSRDLILFTDGRGTLSPSDRIKLKRNGVGVREEKIERLESEGEALRAIVLRGGERVARAALFFNTPSLLPPQLVECLDGKFSQREGIYTAKYEGTLVPGLFAAGNVLRDVQLVIVAAAEGARAAFGINTELAREALK